jgi:protein-L-isoaspartate(D-aspartate) O-methyltransferase
MKITVFFLTSLCFLLIFATPHFVYPQTDAWFEKNRNAMIDEQIKKRGVSDPHVLDAMGKINRHLFVPEQYRSMAYSDHPLPIGHAQTISQPYIVAFMSELLKVKKTDRVLEIGTGSGYQAAVLGEIVKEVYSIEIIEKLGKRSAALLNKLGYTNIFTRIGDGYQGWPEKAPFDKIIVTAAPPEIPPALIEQLKPGGLMIVPVGTTYQELILIEKTQEGIKKKSVLPVRFVPMVKEKSNE